MQEPLPLSRRERQIMDIVYELGEVSAQQVQQRLPDPPSYSSVRTLLGRLEDKGQLSHREQGGRYLYAPLVKRETATRNALRRLVRTFFDGSAVQAANALLGMSQDISDEELDALENLIQQTREREGGDTRKKGRRH